MYRLSIKNVALLHLSKITTTTAIMRLLSLYILICFIATGFLQNLHWDKNATQEKPESISTKRNKIPALTEFGYRGLPDNTRFNSTLLKGLSNHCVSYTLACGNRGISYNGGVEFYVLYQGHKPATGFIL